jgi:nickel/cobalt transporter (NicO) family protein
MMPNASIEQFTLATALVLGLRHALEPGHGKAIIATYMGQPNARFGDVLLIGGIVTLAHSAILGVSILLFFQVVQRIGHVPSQWYVVLQGVSAVGVVILGIVMLQQAWPPGKELSNAEMACSKACSHTPAVLPEPSGTVSPVQRWKELAMLGVFSALRPCPATLSSLMLAVGLGVHQAMGFVLTFSLGMALVLMCIGLGAKLVGYQVGVLRHKNPLLQRVLAYVPFASALIVLIMGLLFTIFSLQHLIETV